MTNAAPLSVFDKLLIVFSHLSPYLGLPFIIPIIVYLVKKDEPASSIVTENAKEALNFHITLALYCIVAFMLCLVLIGFLLFWAIGILTLIFSIVAAVKGVDGLVFRYPATLRLVK